MLTVKIYYLENPETKEPFYVGATTTSLEQRLYTHLYNNPKAKELLSRGLFPEIQLIEEVYFRLAEVTENYWIEQFRAWGFNLSNSTKDTVPLFPRATPNCENELVQIELYRLEVMKTKWYMDNCKKFARLLENKRKSFYKSL